MIRRMIRGCTGVGLILAPLSAVAQQPAGRDNGELFCVYDNVLRASQQGDITAPVLQSIVSQCRQRYGWTPAQTDLGVLLGRVMVEMNLAAADARRMGVDNAVINAVFATFSEDDIIDIRYDGLALAPGSQDIARRAAAGMAQRGVTGNAAVTAARAVVLRLIAAHIAAEFTVALDR